jgi:hypothetical protein
MIAATEACGGRNGILYTKWAKKIFSGFEISVLAV